MERRDRQRALRNGRSSREGHNDEHHKNSDGPRNNWSCTEIFHGVPRRLTCPLRITRLQSQFSGSVWLHGTLQNPKQLTPKPAFDFDVPILKCAGVRRRLPAVWWLSMRGRFESVGHLRTPTCFCDTDSADETAGVKTVPKCAAESEAPDVAWAIFGAVTLAETGKNNCGVSAFIRDCASS